MNNDTQLNHCSMAMSEWLELSMQITFRSHFMFFKERGFSHSQMATLQMLYHRKKCAVNDVSNMQSISKPAASQLLDLLVRRGLVERFESSEDRRIKYHKLSEEGIAMLKESRSARKDWYQSLINDLSGDELLKVSEALEILNKKIRLFGPQPEGCDRGDKHRC